MGSSGGHTGGEQAERGARPGAGRLRALLDGFAGRRVVVLGDMVADEYIIGRPTRLSREAPIPVLEWVDRYIVPGGATNPARNLRALGAEVAVAGVIGRDEPGRALRRQLLAEGIGVEALVEEEGRPTSTNTRVIGGSAQVVSQQIARIDRKVRTPLGADAQGRIAAFLRREIPQAAALLLSDYENGVIGPELIALALPLAAAHGLVTTVDAHGDLRRFRGVTIATPNQDEAAAELGRSLHGDDDICRAGRELLDRMDARNVLITRGSEGMTLAGRDGGCHHLPVSNLSEVRDATGAGDTVAATVTLALVAGAAPLEAAHLGNLAAGIVVRRLGAATTDREELTAEIDAARRRADAAE